MWELSYEKALVLNISDESLDTFLKGAFYKISLRRYVQSASSNGLIFKQNLTYLDYKKIILLCQKESIKRGTLLIVSEHLSDFIRKKELHIEIRSRLGIELKNRDLKFKDQFKTYCSVVNAKMARKLRERQMWDSFFMCSMKKSANFSVPGSGKTASVLGMYAYLKHKGMVDKIIVISPKNAFGSWVDEFNISFKDHETLQVLNIHNYKSAKQRNIALQYDSGACNLILVNYEAMGSVKESLINIIDDKTLLVFDEVHKVKRIDGEYAGNALELSKNANFVVAMTGTPIPNSYTDIYNLLHILFPDEYEEFFNFQVSMLRHPNSNDIDTINNKLQPFFCRTTKEQLNVPKANSDILCVSKAMEEENKLLHILKIKYRKNQLALFVRILQMESNPKLLLENLNLSEFSYLLDDSVEISKIDYVDYSDDVKCLIEKLQTPTKFKECVRLITSIVQQNKTVIVWCIFVDSMKRLSKALTDKDIYTHCIYGEVPLEDRQKILDEFKNGHIQVLITNPHTLAESVSLHSVCHDAIYFEYSYNLVHLLQSKDRIHRLGLPEDQYTQYYYHQINYDTVDGEWSLDSAVYQRLKEKEQIMLDAIDNNILEAMPTSEEDLQLIFSEF